MEKYKNYVVPASEFQTLRILDVGEEEFAVMGKMQPTQRFRYIIHFIVSGKGIFENRTNGSSWALSANTAFAIYKYDAVFYQSDPTDPLHYFWVGFDSADGDAIMNYLGFSQNNAVIRLKDANEVVNAFYGLFDGWKEEDPFKLTERFLGLLRALKKNNPFPLTRPIKQRENETIRQAKTYIELHLADRLKVGDVAEYLHVNRSHFSRLFKKELGVSPHEYATRLKLKHAEWLLVTTDRSVTEIVDMLNFTDVYSFSKLYRKYYHYSPTQYRKKYESLQKH